MNELHTLHTTIKREKEKERTPALIKEIGYYNSLLDELKTVSVIDLYRISEDAAITIAQLGCMKSLLIKKAIAGRIASFSH